MKSYRALVKTLTKSSLREPVGLFFTLIFAPLLVVVFGLIFGNDPNPAFGGRGFVDATLPATACLVVAITGTLLLPVNQLQLRERGALTRLRITPLKPAVYVAADLTVNFVVSMAGILLALAVGVLLFHVKVHGNLILVFLAAALGLIAFLALGYTLAAIYPSSAAASGIGNGVMIVLVMTSGAFFPLAALPAGVQAAINLSPLRHLVVLVQGIWEGGHWGDYLLSTGVLVGMIVVFGALGARLFKWK